MTHLTPITEEQRENARLKRLAAQEYARNHLKITYADADYWRSLSSEQGLKMPHWWIKGTETKYIRRTCKKLGIDVAEYVESTGFKNLKEFTENNEKYSAFAMVGLCLEYFYENRAQKDC
jgi:hypothetical protein